MKISFESNPISLIWLLVENLSMSRLASTEKIRQALSRQSSPTKAPSSAGLTSHCISTYFYPQGFVCLKPFYSTLVFILKCAKTLLVILSILKCSIHIHCMSIKYISGYCTSIHLGLSYIIHYCLCFKSLIGIVILHI